jgi:4-methyl-5(b-hydroxyethyl)-thiazole monophosphate biosynthesis
MARSLWVRKALNQIADILYYIVTQEWGAYLKGRSVGSMTEFLMPLADGFEEIEATTTIDILRRGGVNVTTAGLQGTIVRSVRGVKLITDMKMDDVNVDKFDGMILVGGDPGWKNLSMSKRVMDAVHKYNGSKKTLAAICAAPCILAKAGILAEKRATVYPGMERELPRPRSEKVIADGHIITSQGPGTAVDFALKIVELSMGKDRAAKVKKDIVY